MNMLQAGSVEDVERVMQSVVDTEKEYVIGINKNKSNIIVFSNKEKPEDIGGIKNGKKFKYLEITSDKQKIMMIKRAIRMANMIHTIIARKCSRLMIRKAYWKRVALPVILYRAKHHRLHKIGISLATKNREKFI